MEHAILTAIAQDRPGVVEEVTAFIAAAGGNIEESRMVNLRGQFAVMILLHADQAALDKLRRALPDLRERSRIHAEIHSVSAPHSPPASGAPPLHRFKASALDRQGLVHQVAHIFRARGVNIESVQTHLRPAPVSGAPLFEMEMLLAIPQTTAIEDMKRELGEVCRAENIDWELEKC